MNHIIKLIENRITKQEIELSSLISITENRNGNEKMLSRISKTATNLNELRIVLKVAELILKSSL
jgi:hypothetical protein